MIYKMHYDSSLGGMLLSADDKGLTGVWFDGQKYYAQGQADLEPEAGAAICNAPCKEEHAPLLADVKRWLDIYFAGKEPDFDLPLNPTGTDFQKSVWSIMKRFCQKWQKSAVSWSAVQMKQSVRL